MILDQKAMSDDPTDLIKRIMYLFFLFGFNNFRLNDNVFHFGKKAI